MARWNFTPLLFAGGALAVLGGAWVLLAPRSSARAAAPPDEPPALPPAPPHRAPAAPPAPPPSGLETGSQFAQRVLRLTGSARDREVEAAVARGNLPPFLREFVPVTVQYQGHTGTVFAMPDYLGIGTAPGPAGDWIITPVGARTAQRIADRMGWVLPTVKLVEAIHAAAAVKIGFRGFSPRPGVGRESTQLLIESMADVQRKRAGRQGLASGHKKDIVLANVLTEHPGKVAIYGGREAGGALVQSLFPPHGSPAIIGHDTSYTDYSQPPRYLAPEMIVDGARRQVLDVARDPVLYGLVSDSPLRFTRYST